MDFDINFIAAEPETTWIEDIIFRVVTDLPVELFGESRPWDVVITRQPFIYEFNVCDAKEVLFKLRKYKTISKNPIFPKDALDSEIDFKQYLESTPLRIMITGDEQPSFFEIGDILVKKFGTYHITPKELVMQQIRRRTRIGKWLNWNLKEGSGIPIWIIIQLLDAELKKEKYALRGFILTGFPIIPDLNTELGIPCEFDDDEDAYSDYDIEKFLEEEEEIGEEEATLPMPLSSSSLSVNSDYGSQEDILKLFQNKKFVRLDGSEDEILGNCVRKQLDFIHNLSSRPEYFVYLDVNYYTKQFAAILDALQTFLLFYLMENVIIIDYRIGLKAVLDSIFNRFYYINYKVNYEACSMNTHENSRMSLEEICNTDKILPRCKWWVSEFNRICPVNLYNGRLRFCDSKFPVHYLRYILLCFSSRDRKKFIVNPIKYMNLLPTCRVAVIGAHRTGKTTLSNYLAHYLKADIYRSHIEQSEISITEENMEDFTDKALTEELKNLEKLRLRDFNTFKEKKIEEWTSCVFTTINELLKIFKASNFQLFSNKQADKCFKEIHNSLNSNTGIKQLILENAYFKKSIQSISSNDFLDWISIKSQSSRLYRQYVLDSAPLDIDFWEDLLIKDELPDCVFFLKTSSVNKMDNIYSLIHGETCIDDNFIHETICNNFSNWKEFLGEKRQVKYVHRRTMDESTRKYLKHLVSKRYKEALNFTEKYVKIQSLLHERDVICIEVDISNQSWTQSILNAITEYLSLYQTKARALQDHSPIHSPSVTYENEEQDGSMSSSLYNEYIENGGLTESDFSLKKLINFGYFQDRCPVLLCNHNILLKGDMRFAAEYKNEVYVMHSANALSQFLSDPLRFSQKKPTIVPPPRVFILGLCHRNKIKFAESLASSLNVELVSCMKSSMTMPYNSIFSEDFHQYIKSVRNSYFKTKNKLLEDLSVKYRKGAVIFGFPLLLQQFNDAIAHKMYPECIIMFNDKEEVLDTIYRYFVKLYTMQYFASRVSITGASSLEFRVSTSSEVGTLPSTIKSMIYEKCKLVLQPFLLEMHNIEDVCKKLQIPIIKVPRKSYKRAGLIDYYVSKINQNGHRSSMFENVESITMKESEMLLDSGYYRYSRFKRSCPVDVSRLITLNRFEGMRRQGLVYPCIFRDFIYFVCGKKNLKDFKRNPLEFVNTCNPPQMLDPMRIAVFGPSKSGVTTLCRAISQELGLKIFSKYDFPDGPISDSAIIDCLQMNALITPNGIILDNIPLTPNLLVSAARNTVDITAVFILVTSFNKILDNWYMQSRRIKNCPSLSLPEVHRQFCESVKSIRCMRKSTIISLFNIHYLDGNVNSWTIWEKVNHELIKTTRSISGYSIKLRKNRSACLVNLNLFYDTILFKRQINHYYCQVCLCLGKLNAFKYYYVNVGEEFYSKECQKLLNRPYGYLNDNIYTMFNFSKPFNVNDIIKPLDTQKRFCMYMFQYKNAFYWTCDLHTINFMLYSEQFYRDGETLKPLYVPFLVIGYTRKFVAFQGYCPVEYEHGKLVKGIMNLSVYYRKKVYLMANKENTIEFLSFPEKYSQLTFDPNLYSDKKPVTYHGLSEDTVSTVLLDLSNARPKHFALNGKQSAATFFALKLKATSANEKYTDYWNTSLRNFVKDCKKLDEELTHRVPVPDERFDYLCDYHKPVSKVPAYLNVVDIAGLVKGAAEGQGLGNAFLSHISACDSIFHLCRAFEDPDVTHVEGEVDPVRDLDIISEELRLKDEEKLIQNLDKLEKVVARGGDKKLKPEYDSLLKVKSVLITEKRHLRFADWNAHDIETLNKCMFLTTKPAIYLINLSDKDFIRKKNKWLAKIKEWVDKNDPGATIIPFSGHFEHNLAEKDESERKVYEEETKCKSVLDKIIVTGYKALQLEYFFTAGPDEVKAWTIQKGTKAPQAAGRIHTDFEKGFIMAEVMHFKDFKEEGSEAAAKAAGKYRQQGRNYVVEDGDIIFFKFNAGAGLKDAKKK